MAGSGGYIGMRPALNKGMWQLSNSVENFQHPFTALTATGGTLTTTTFGSYTFNIHTFSYTGSDQTFTITNRGIGGPLLVTAYMWGAAGGGASAEGYSDSGGPGGFATGFIDVTEMSSLIVQVGGGGGRGDTSRPARPYPAGGLNSVRSGYTSGCGGGRSAIFKTSVSAVNAILIAGGGGGAGGHGNGGASAGNGITGGAGGGTTGGGGFAYNGATIVNGGTQSAPGSYQTGGLVGTAPGQLQGGDAGNGTAFPTGWNAAGGGGDGWYGGGAQEAHIGGGGGSGYFNPLYVSSGSLQSTTLSSSKLGSTSPPQTGNAYYAAGIGAGGANANGGNGRIVMIYRAT